MKFLFDFFPILLFFIVFNQYTDQLAGIIAATQVMILASIAQIGLFWWRHRRFEKMHLITLAIVVVFGGATIIFKDAVFIKWKPTIANWMFAVAFIGSHFIGDKPLVQRMMNQGISLPDLIWRRLNISWTIFFIGMGTVNLYVAFTYSLATWVSFKTWGLLGLTLTFVVAQAFYLARHIPPEDAEKKPTGAN